MRRSEEESLGATKKTMARGFSPSSGRIVSRSSKGCWADVEKFVSLNCNVKLYNGVCVWPFCACEGIATPS